MVENCWSGSYWLIKCLLDENSYMMYFSIYKLGMFSEVRVWVPVPKSTLDKALWIHEKMIYSRPHKGNYFLHLATLRWSSMASYGQSLFKNVEGSQEHLWQEVWHLGYFHLSTTKTNSILKRIQQQNWTQ